MGQVQPLQRGADSRWGTKVLVGVTLAMQHVSSNYIYIPGSNLLSYAYWAIMMLTYKVIDEIIVKKNSEP